MPSSAAWRTDGTGGIAFGGAAGPRDVVGGASPCSIICSELIPACSSDAEANIASTSWKYVGDGRGAFRGVQTYNYVGEGGGNFDREIRTTYYGWKARPCCIVVTFLLLILGLLYLLSTWSTLSRSTTPVISAPRATVPPAASPAVSEAPYNCNTFIGLSDEKISWCCRKYNVMCPTTLAPRIIEVTVQVPVSVPAPAPVVQVITTSGVPYDCSAGYDEWPMQWVKGWGGAKKLYCCSTAGRGCPSELPPPSGRPPSGLPPGPDVGPYDCNAGYHNCYSCLLKHWSANKLNWCCRVQNTGCQSNTPLHG